MKKLSFASPILFTTILLFAAACGKNTAAETVPPQTQIASESDFSEETSMNGQTGSITPESSATDLIGNAPSETASGSNSNGNSAANGTAAETQDDEDNGECLILPDGSVEEPLPSHIGRLVELTGMDAGALHGRMEKNMEPLFWLVEYTGCMSVWQTRVVAPTVPTGQQQAALEELHDAAFLAPKYLMQTPGQEYVESVHRAKKELGDR